MQFDPFKRTVKTRTSISIHHQLVDAALRYGEDNKRTTNVPMSVSEIIGAALLEYLSSKLDANGVPYIDLQTSKE